MHSKHAAMLLLCLAIPARAADATDQDDDHARKYDPVLAEPAADLTTSLRVRLAPARPRQADPGTAAGVATATEPFAVTDMADLAVSLAAFQDEHAEAEEGGWVNRIGLFVGATTKDGSTHPTIGLEYEYRLDELLGIGAVAEASPGGRELVFAVPVFFHPWEGLAFSIGPGFSIEDGHAAFLVRLGIGWEFELPDGFSLGPVVSYDLTEGNDDAIVYGLILSYGF